MIYNLDIYICTHICILCCHDDMMHWSSLSWHIESVDEGVHSYDRQQVKASISVCLMLNQKSVI